MTRLFGPCWSVAVTLAKCRGDTWKGPEMSGHTIQGVQQNCSHLVICSFAGFYSCKLQKLGGFWKIQEICYMIGTRILKIDLEITEIFEVKVANFNMEIIFLLLCNSKMSISKWWLPILTSIILTISKSIFKILVPIMQQISWTFQNYPNFWN